MGSGASTRLVSEHVVLFSDKRNQGDCWVVILLHNNAKCSFDGAYLNEEREKFESSSVSFSQKLKMP